MADYDPPDQRPERSELRRQALVEFITAGVTPSPAKAVLVSALGEARLEVDSLRRGSSTKDVDGWLRDRAGVAGIRAYAAVAAAIEIPEFRDNAWRWCSQEYPERMDLLRNFIDYA